MNNLPNLTTLALGAHHSITLLAGEGCGEGGHVHECAVDAEFWERVREVPGLQARLFGAHVRGPTARVAEEEALLRREAVDAHRAGFAFERSLEGRIRDHQSAEIGDGFTGDQFAVHV